MKLLLTIFCLSWLFLSSSAQNVPPFYPYDIAQYFLNCTFVANPPLIKINNVNELLSISTLRSAYSNSTLVLIQLTASLYEFRAVSGVDVSIPVLGNNLSCSYIFGQGYSQTSVIANTTNNVLNLSKKKFRNPLSHSQIFFSPPVIFWSLLSAIFSFYRQNFNGGRPSMEALLKVWTSKSKELRRTKPGWKKKIKLNSWAHWSLSCCEVVKSPLLGFLPQWYFW